MQGRAARCYVLSIGYTHAATDPRVRRHCETLVRHGFRVIQLGLGSELERPVARLHGVVLVRHRTRRYRGKNLVRYARAYLTFFVWARSVVRRVAQRRRVTAVQANNIPNFSVWSALPGRRFGAGILLDIHDPVPELFISKFGTHVVGRVVARVFKLEERWSASRADLVLCVNEPHREATVSHGVPASKIRVVPNVADDMLFPKQPPRRASAYVAYHGTVARRLGLDVMLRAVREVIDSGQPLRAAIWGDGDAVDELVKLREDLGLIESVDLTGRRVALEDLVGHLREVGIGIVSLRRDVSTDLMLPTKLMEYVRLGIPVVVTWTPTIARYFPENAVSYIREFTPTSLARAIRQLIARPDDARDMAARAQAQPIARGWREMEQEYVDMVKEIGLGPQH